jgi:hypothetical protein
MKTRRVVERDELRKAERSRRAYLPAHLQVPAKLYPVRRAQFGIAPVKDAPHSAHCRGYAVSDGEPALGVGRDLAHRLDPQVPGKVTFGEWP